MVSAAKEYIGQGAYSIADASRITGVHYNTIRRWLDPRDGIVPRAFDPSEQTISFNELMELHFVKMFKDAGVTFQTIRKAALTASKRFGSNYPFTVKRFDTDGRTIFATLVSETSDRELVEDLKRGQYVFKTILRPFFRKLDYGTNEINRYWPNSKRGRVVLDPQRQFGRPIDATTGIPTKTLYQAVIAGKGQTAKVVAKWFDIPVAAVNAAVRFEKSLL